MALAQVAGEHCWAASSCLCKRTARFQCLAASRVAVAARWLEQQLCVARLWEWLVCAQPLLPASCEVPVQQLIVWVAEGA